MNNHQRPNSRDPEEEPGGFWIVFLQVTIVSLAFLWFVFLPAIGLSYLLGLTK